MRYGIIADPCVIEQDVIGFEIVIVPEEGVDKNTAGFPFQCHAPLFKIVVELIVQYADVAEWRVVAVVISEQVGGVIGNLQAIATGCVLDDIVEDLVVCAALDVYGTGIVVAAGDVDGIEQQ